MTEVSFDQLPPLAGVIVGTCLRRSARTDQPLDAHAVESLWMLLAQHQ